MTDATSRPGVEGRTGRGTGDDPAGSHSPLVTPTETEAPDLDKEARPAGTTGAERRGDEGGFGGDSVVGRDKASGLGRGTGSAGVGGGTGREARLLPHDECDKLSARLQHAVAGFVDEPRSAVEEADHVLEEVAARFADAVKQRRRTLRNSWQAGDGGQNKAVSTGDTEQLRLALRDYRELTERLLHS
ncbi:hypothetical protein ACFXKY_03920 [Streptomyces canus]|uniref:hypothetical protein n=1 Tax=Streptomyces canus TaxID=58343 RepID=UPI0036880629